MKSNFKQTEIGEIPEEWNISKLNDFVIFINGYSFNSKDFVKKTINTLPVFKMGNIVAGGGIKIQGDEDNVPFENMIGLDKFMTKENDILMCMTDMKSSMNLLGYSARIKHERFFVNQRVGIIRPTEKIDPQFLYYYLNYWDYIERLRYTANSGVQVNLTSESIKNSTILIPPSTEQRNIAIILSSLDDKIELNRKMNKTLEEMAKALFKHWFVNFEFPNEEGKPYKSSGGEMVESEFGIIPKEWKIATLEDIAGYLNGLPMQKYPQKTDSYLPVIKIRELKSGITDSTDKADVNIPPEYIIHNGDVLFSWSGSLDITMWCGGEGALNQHLFKVTSNKYPKWFYYEWLQFYLPEFQDIAADKATTMGHIQRRHLKEKLVLVPQEDLFNKMNAIMEPLIERVIINKSEIITLIKMRDSLLPKLMSGKIRTI